MTNDFAVGIAGDDLTPLPVGNGVHFVEQVDQLRTALGCRAELIDLLHRAAIETS